MMTRTGVIKKSAAYLNILLGSKKFLRGDNIEIDKVLFDKPFDTDSGFFSVRSSIGRLVNHSSSAGSHSRTICDTTAQPSGRYSNADNALITVNGYAFDTEHEHRRR